jgi:HEAT repeat protein
LLDAIDNSGEHVDVRRRAVESVAYLDADEVRDIIAAAYESVDESMRITAIFAMGRSADTVWSETVQAELLSTSPAMRYEAARACGELEIRQAVSALGRLIQDPDPEVQVVAIGALGQIGGQRARRLLERCLRGRSEVLREAAEHALAELMLGEGSLDLFIYGSPSGSDDDSGIGGDSE